MSDIQEFNFNVNLLRAILWQYNEASNLQGLLNAKNAWYEANQSEFWESWITDVFDLRTANDFGLQVWSIILGQSLYTNYVIDDTEDAFGFGDENQNFDNGIFGSVTGGTNVYSTEVARLLLRLRYFQLVSSGTIPETNRMLKYLFADYGDAYLIDNYDMTQTYILDFAIPSEMRYMLYNTDILPRPAAVGSQIAEPTDLVFGFGSFNNGFDQGAFGS